MNIYIDRSMKVCDEEKPRLATSSIEPIVGRGINVHAQGFILSAPICYPLFMEVAINATRFNYNLYVPWFAIVF